MSYPPGYHNIFHISQTNNDQDQATQRRSIASHQSTDASGRVNHVQQYHGSPETSNLMPHNYTQPQLPWQHDQISNERLYASAHFNPVTSSNLQYNGAVYMQDSKPSSWQHQPQQQPGSSQQYQQQYHQQYYNQHQHHQQHQQQSSQQSYQESALQLEPATSYMSGPGTESVYNRQTIYKQPMPHTVQQSTPFQSVTPNAQRIPSRTSNDLTKRGHDNVSTQENVLVGQTSTDRQDVSPKRLKITTNAAQTTPLQFVEYGTKPLQFIDAGAKHLLSQSQQKNSTIRQQAHGELQQKQYKTSPETSFQQRQVVEGSQQRSSNALPTIPIQNCQTLGESHQKQHDNSQQRNFLPDVTKKESIQKTPRLGPLQQPKDIHSSQQFSILEPLQQPKDIHSSQQMSTLDSLQPHQDHSSQQISKLESPITQPKSMNSSEQKGRTASSSEAAFKPEPSSALSTLRTSQVEAPAVEELDRGNTLLCLAEEYSRAAHEMPILTQDDMTQYQRLVQLAMSCLESALLNCRNTPRTEAHIRLKLAAMIHEETTDDATEILSKGIAACDRNRLPDLKYTMHYLLICILHSKKPQAAIKAADKLITELKDSNLHHWTIAYRLLKFSLCYQGDASEVSLLKQLAIMKKVEHGVNLSCLIACLEALVSLRSGTQEGLESAQRALAEVKSHQSDAEMEQSGQLKALLVSLTMACLTTTGVADSMHAAAKPMQVEHNAASAIKCWSSDGSFPISLNVRCPLQLVNDSAGIFTSTNDVLHLNVNWLSKKSMLALSYMLAGIAVIPSNGETHQAETVFKEGLKLLQDTNTRPHGSYHDSLMLEQANATMTSNTHFLLASTYASVAQYTRCISQLSELRTASKDMDEKDQMRLQYLTAACLQGLGEPKKAHDLYMSWLKRLHQDSDTSAMMKDLAALATLNSVHPATLLSGDDDPARVDALVEEVRDHCIEHPNKAYSAIYHLIKATTIQLDEDVMSAKSVLNQAFAPAQIVKNKLILSIMMNIMCEQFFKNVVGSQALKSANAARSLAKSSGDPLWISMGSGKLCDSLARTGKMNQAAEANQAAIVAISAIPEKVRDVLALG